MKKYRVYQDGISCEDHIKKSNIHHSWKHDLFDTKYEAEIYAVKWVYPVSSQEEAKQFHREMEIGKEYDMSFCEIPVMMKIEEVEI